MNIDGTGELKRKILELGRSKDENALIDIAIQIIVNSENLFLIYQMAFKAFELLHDAQMLPIETIDYDVLAFRLREMKADLSDEIIASIIRRLRLLKKEYTEQIIEIIKYNTASNGIIDIGSALNSYWKRYGLDLLRES